MKYKNLYFLGLLFGGLSLLGAVLGDFYWIRIVAGYLFYFVFLGMPVAAMFFGLAYGGSEEHGCSSALTGRDGKPSGTLGFFEVFVLSVGFSVLLLYPTGVLLAMIEGKSGEVIYSSHLVMGLCIALGIYLATGLGLFVFNKKFFGEKVGCAQVITLKDSKSITSKVLLILLIILLTSAFFNFYNLNRADLNTDEYDLGYRSYNLVDGMRAGRNAYLLSYIDHPPLAMQANHFSMQLLSDLGIEKSADWHFRFLGGLIVMMCVLLTYMLVFQATGSYGVALFCAGALAICNSQVFLARAVLRSVFVEFYFLLAAFYYFKFASDGKRSYLWLMGIFSGAILLTKSSVFPMAFIVPLMLLIDGYRSNSDAVAWKAELKMKFLRAMKVALIALLIFLPVIVYNITIYVVTGHLDIMFSKMFGIDHPFGYTGDSIGFAESIRNARQYVNLLADQFGIPYLILAAISVAGLIFYRSKKMRIARFSSLTLIIMTLFFILVGFRAYYVTILAPFIVIMMGLLIAAVLRYRLLILGVIVVAAVLTHSFIYTYNTHIRDDIWVESEWIDSGRAGEYKVPDFCMSCTYSRTTRPWVQNRGWKELAERVQKKVDRNDLLVIDGTMDVTFMRRYLDIDVRVEKYYLGDRYQEPFQWVYDFMSYRPLYDKLFYLNDADIVEDSVIF